MTDAITLWALSWTFVHVLWIGTIIGAAAAGLGFCARRSPRCRHGMALVALTALAATPAFAYTYLSSAVNRSAPPMIRATSTPSLTDSAEFAPRISTATPAPPTLTWDWLAAVCDLLPLIWIGGATVLALRLTAGTWRVRKLIASAEHAGERIEAAAQAAGLAIGLRRAVRVTVTRNIDSPVTAGFWRPVILLPQSALEWPGEALDMVLLHEFIHVHRRDNFVNFAQRIIECGLFFHPVVRWLSRWIHFERERCCDASVVALTGRPHAYVRTLLALASREHDHYTPLLAMSRNPLVERIRTILNKEPAIMIAPRPVLIATLAACAFSVLIIGTQAQTPPRPQSPTTPVSTPHQKQTSPGHRGTHHGSCPRCLSATPHQDPEHTVQKKAIDCSACHTAVNHPVLQQPKTKASDCRACHTASTHSVAARTAPKKANYCPACQSKGIHSAHQKPAGTKASDCSACHTAFAHSDAMRTPPKKANDCSACHIRGMHSALQKPAGTKASDCSACHTAFTHAK